MKNSNEKMNKIINLCKNAGFIFQSSEIYGGLANTWDYGPLGVELKNNIKKAWFKKFVQECEYNVGFDAAILMNPKVWEASEHLKNFSDPLIDCKDCKFRFRADKLVENFCIEKNLAINVNKMSFQDISDFIEKNEIQCPQCGAKNFTDIRNFNLMFKTFQGVTTESNNEIYLRPETAQGIFINFSNILRSTRRKLPFGVAQAGKSFRNEITPGNFIFRTREFEQMELEFFCKPQTNLKWYDFWKNFCEKWFLDLGINKKNIRFREHEKEELSHYSTATSDIEYLFPFGWGELCGIADRTDYDLNTHQKFSGKSLEYFDSETNEKYLPYIVEPSLGLDRSLLAFLCDAYVEEKIKDEKNDDTRIVLKLHPALAPYKVCVLPLTKKLSTNSKKIFYILSKKFIMTFDETGSIGKRYRKQDEIGTPFCVTYDFESETDNSVTVRNRDTMQQVRINIEKLLDFIEEKIDY